MVDQSSTYAWSDGWYQTPLSNGYTTGHWNVQNYFVFREVYLQV